MTQLAFINTRDLFRVNSPLFPRGPALRYFEFNYPAGYVLEVQRLGECSGCGACCTHTIQLNVAPGRLRPFNLDAIDYHPDTTGQGVWNVVTDDAGWHHTTQINLNPYKGLPLAPQPLSPHTCPAFDVTRRNCTIHHTGKPMLCQLWPMGENEARLFDECTYYFRPVAAWQLDAAGNVGEAISLESVI